MYTYILPVENVLLEYVVKLGGVIFFPGEVNENDINNSKLNNGEKEELKEIVRHNCLLFGEAFSRAYMLFKSEISYNDCASDFNLLDKIFEEGDRALDYIRILECPFMKPEYLLGTPGLVKDTRMAIGVDEDYKLSFNFYGAKYYYSMQKGIGLDISSHESEDPLLYQILFSDRKDEVYLKYRKLIGEACDALKLNDDSRAFVYLFSKVDGMGLCDAYNFKENKIRILSLIAEDQKEFDLLSNQLYFYSKSIRTEVVHKGKSIAELVSLDKARDMNQQLFNIILEFCCAAITSNILRIEDLKLHIDSLVGKFVYISPESEGIYSLPAIVYKKTTYVAFAEGVEVNEPQKRGSYILLPKRSEWSLQDYYRYYSRRNMTGELDGIFDDFSIDDFEYVLEILYRLNSSEGSNEDSAIIIALNMPKYMDDYMSSMKYREMVADDICNQMGEVFYYEVLNGTLPSNGDLLPPRVGLKSGIRALYEFVEEPTEMYLLGIPGRVYGMYVIPDTCYVCDKVMKNDIFNALFYPSNYIHCFYKNALISLCESQYFYDNSLRTSYLFDVFDSLEPRTTDGDKTAKTVFAFLASDKNDYLSRKQMMASYRVKYRNPILHSGKNIYEIETDNREIAKLQTFLHNIIVEFCLKIISNGIDSWEEFDSQLTTQKSRLGLI